MTSNYEEKKPNAYLDNISYLYCVISPIRSKTIVRSRWFVTCNWGTLSENDKTVLMLCSVRHTATRHGLLDDWFGKNAENIEPVRISAHAVGVLFFHSQLSGMDGFEYHKTVQKSWRRRRRTPGDYNIEITRGRSPSENRLIVQTPIRFRSKVTMRLIVNSGIVGFWTIL